MAQDNASLKISVNSTDVKNAKKDLDNLSVTSGKTEQSTNKLSSSFKGLGIAMSAVASSLLVNKFIELSDATTNVNNQLKLVTKNSLELKNSQTELFKIAQKTRQSYKETAGVFSNFALSMGEMGKSQKEILRVTETVNKAIAISGGTAQQAAAATMQLGQAFASGTLRGDELNSILENSKGLARAIADGMGVPIGRLRELGSEGKITAEVLAAALDKSAQSVDDKFSQMTATVDQAMTTVKNSIMQTVGTINEATRATDALSKRISEFSGFLDNSQADLAHFAVFTVTTVERTIDLFNLLYETVENTAQMSVNGISIITYGALDSIAQMTLKAAKGLHSVGLASDNTLKKNQAFADFTKNEYNVAIQSSLDNQNEILEAANKFNPTIEERVALMYKEVEASKILQNNQKESEKNKQKQISATKELTEAEKEAIKVHAEFLTAWEDSEYADRQKEIAGYLYNQTVELERQKQLEQEKANLAMEALQIIEDPIDRINKKFMTMFELIKEGLDPDQAERFGLAYSKAIEDVSKEIKKSEKYEGIGSGDWTNSLDDQFKGLVNIGKAFDDVAKEQKEWTKFNKENLATEEDKNKHLKNQIGMYGSIAGAVGSMYEEGSSGAKAMMQVQQALAIVEGGLAVVHQMTAGDPYTAIPRAVAVAAMVAQFIDGFGGSGGGGGAISASTIQESEFNTALTELSMQPMLDELERQTELLEIIGLEGTAGRARLEQSGTQFTMDTKLLAEEIIRGTQTTSVKAGYGLATTEGVVSAWENQFSKVNDKIGDATTQLFSIDEALTTVTFNSQVFRDNALQSMSALYEYGLLNMLTNWQEAVKEGATNDQQIQAFQTAMGTQRINELQEITHDYIMTLADVRDGMIEAKDTFIDLHDALVDFDDSFEKSNLDLAFKEVNKVLKESGKSYTEYVSEQISAIQRVEKEFNRNITELFLSQDPADLQEQIDALAMLNGLMDDTFINGTQQAVDFIEHIELVGEAMAVSRDNIQSFADSFMNDEQLANVMAQDLGVDLAENMDGLALLFRELADDTEGLTDAELELLEANKSLIESGLDDYINEIVENISSLEGVVSSLSSVIDNLRGSAIGAEYTLDQYRKAMSKAMSLSGSDDYEGFAEAVKDAIAKSSVLSDKSLYTASREMEFAQLVAASQFENMELETLEQIDYLRMIEENTSEHNLLMIDLLREMGAKIDDALLTEVLDNNTAIINRIYEEELGRSADTAGLDYWKSDLSGGQSVTDVAKSISASPEAQIYDFYAKAGVEPTSEGMAYWLNDVSSGQSLDDVKNSFETLFPTVAFANGGIVTAPTMGLIGEAGYSEAVIPLKNPNDPLNQNGLISEIGKQFQNLDRKQNAIISVLKESKDIQDLNLQKLTLIEEAS